MIMTDLITDPKKPELHKILEAVAAEKSRNKKGEILRTHNCLALRDFLKGSFDDSIEWNLPEGVPPFECVPEYARSNLNKISPQLANFVKGGKGDKIQDFKRETLFINFISSISEEDAKLYIKMKDKELTGMFNGLTKKLVQSVYPTLIEK
jgi:hypothetical protein